LLANILCGIIIYGLSPRHDFAVIQLFGASKADGSHGKVEIRQADMKMKKKSSKMHKYFRLNFVLV